MKRIEIEKVYKNLDNKEFPLNIQILFLKNKLKLKREFELIQEVRSIQFLDSYKDYYSKMTSTQSEIIRDELNKEYDDIIKEQLFRNIEINNFLNEEIDIDYYVIGLEYVPDDLYKYKEELVETLMIFIKE